MRAVPEIVCMATHMLDTNSGLNMRVNKGMPGLIGIIQTLSFDGFLIHLDKYYNYRGWSTIMEATLPVHSQALMARFKVNQKVLRIYQKGKLNWQTFISEILQGLKEYPPTLSPTLAAEYSCSIIFGSKRVYLGIRIDSNLSPESSFGFLSFTVAREVEIIVRLHHRGTP